MPITALHIKRDCGSNVLSHLKVLLKRWVDVPATTTCFREEAFHLFAKDI